MTIIPSVAKVKQVVLFLSVSCVLSCNRYVADWGDASVQEEKEVFSPTLDIPDIHLYEPEYYPLFKKEVIGESARQYTGPSIGLPSTAPIRHIPSRLRT